MVRIPVSACLLGEGCATTDGTRPRTTTRARWEANGRLVRFCPEVAGGLGVPRRAAGIRGASVVAAEGTGVTAAFVEALQA